MKDFWNSEITEASWIGLQELRKEIAFVLIGGWATYLYSRLQKSKDIDIIIDYNTLRALESRYTLSKNERLKKYEIKTERYDVDIYLPGYSPLTLPPKEIMSRYTTMVEGFSVPTPEALMALKLGAAAERGASTKGRKDSIDILGLLFYSGFDVQLFSELLKEHGLVQYMRLLKSVLEGFDKNDIDYLNLNQNSFARLKRMHLSTITKYL
jgi:hypothetical protein